MKMTQKEHRGLSPAEELRKFARTILFRNAREWVACAIVVVAFA